MTGDVQAAPAEPRSVAIVHDYLNQFGGAEMVVLELARTWPGAPIYTSLYRPGSTFAAFREQTVRVSPLDRMPVDARFRALAPAYPLAFRALGRLSDELVVSSSSGWAHGIRTEPESLHVVYCHTPARWLYRPDEYLGHSVGQTMLRPLTGALRRWDQAAAARADLYVANSRVVRERIRAVYRREATVIHPPVDVGRFTPRQRGERLLVLSRLLPYKRVDLVVRAANRAGLWLDVVGDGPALGALRELAGPTVRFHGRVDERALVELLENCRALCVAATEDFGITPVEAAAAGKPVVAYAEGGALETVRDGLTGALFDELTVESLLGALARADALPADPRALRAHAQEFSAEAFRRRFRELVGEELARRRPHPG
jgi:glycosyltransferase involved in cell wall biosynthesis